MKRLVLPLLLAFSPASFAQVGDVLFVNYNGSDNSVETALAADGHTVTAVDVPPNTASAYFSSTDLSGYCAVVWSGAYAYDEDVAGATSVLSNWVADGGSVLVTAPDAIRSQSTDMIQFLGGSSARDENLNFSTIANVANSLTIGLVDIRGLTPPDISDQDTLCGPLVPGTVGLVTGTATPDSTCPNDEGYAWTLRSLGNGQIAFITSGNFTTGDDPDWSDTTIPGDGVYNAALRNFARAACTPRAEARSVPALSPPSLVVLFTLLLMLAAFSIRHPVR
ncbi:hypothetical protein [Wenzhouxiangella marina]|uniref:Uncharacterized protein n=1 Tax=Wenzhouxiangella marina TaxID=1579979 RepID=A0A0K0XWQ8_9GAMM|nr:hypothetical protein [Wenzhouxiangella marina]AKS42105.1 hypothetical protein WM2015_1736 [Wenzhouxiangella marina]MBB6086125.1 hypothetical protein [Wenzhouxiangella marina]